MTPTRKRYLRIGGMTVLLFIVFVLCYGYFVGRFRYQVHNQDISFYDLPADFEGYRIVQFSDIHVGSISGGYEIEVQKIVDLINQQHPDLIVFTGDIVNRSADELANYQRMFSGLSAPDGVLSVLGNHDYAVYVDADEKSKEENCRRTREQEEQMGWTLLLNDHRIIRRGSDSIVMAGMENWGTKKRMPRRGDVKKTLAGISPESFVVMLQHDPSCWREKILPECKAQLTLSGHTHGGQFSLFGWSPAALSYDEWNGMTYEGSRAIYVSAGAGALIPFRLGMPREIVVITLKVRK